LADPSGTRVEHGAAPSFPASFINSIIGRPLKIDEGPCGLAVRLNEQVIVADLTTETRWPDLRRLILAHGLRSCWSTPISSAAGKILGTFGVYYREPKTPTSLHQSLLEQFKHIARIAIERRLSEEALSKVRSELAHVARAQSLGVLTASIAHEVNQPLTAVVNNANACLGLLPDSAPHLQEVRNALAEIVEDADRASTVIARVRKLVSKAPYARTPLKLGDVVADVLVLARHEFAARHVTILTELAEDVPPVTADRVQLQQVLLNLVVNGMDAMNATEESKRALIIQGHPEIRDGERVAVLTVRDAGSGIKLDEMDRLFEAFYTTKPQGMGMGLAISRSIIEAHGGRLWAEPNQGPGATFLFSLPAAVNVTS